MAALAGVLVMQAVPLRAQDETADTRLRRLEAEMREIQRKVFPGADGKFFTPEIAAPAAGAANGAALPGTSAVTDILARMESLEAQLARLTAEAEQNAHRIAQLEARAGIAPPAPASAATAPATNAAVSAPAATVPAATVPATAAATPAAPAPAPSPTVAAPAPAPAAPAPAVAAARPAAAPAAAPAAPSAQRLAAVRAIEKPQTSDPGDDEYNYGFRLWEAKFFPEAQQQLKLFIDKYPSHAMISHGRNLLGRSYLDDNKPRDAASWFLRNYQADKNGRRASDSLLYLGVAMKQINDTNRACIALAEFSETYAAEAAGRLKSLYDQTRAGLKCSK